MRRRDRDHCLNGHDLRICGVDRLGWCRKCNSLRAARSRRRRLILLRRNGIDSRKTISVGDG